jgi:positive phototaxis protein PixI
MATESAVSKATVGSEQFLSFVLPPEQKVIVSTKQLVEILNISLTQIVPIPDVPPFVMGACNWRGEVLWVADLGYMLGFEPLYQQGFNQPTYKVILLRSQGQTLGLAVRNIKQMMWCDPSQIQSSSTNYVTSDLSSCIQGYYLSPDRELMLVLDGDALFQTMDA